MNEQISALTDGELNAEDFQHDVISVLAENKAMQAWRDYQLIGDVMRGSSPLSSGFTSSVMQKLELEPTVLAPNAIIKSTKQVDVKHDLNLRKSDRLPAVWSIAASCAAVLMVGWVLLNQQLGDFTNASSMQVAATVQTPQKVDVSPVSVNQGAAAQNPIENSEVPLEYLAAHQVSAPSVGSYYQTASYSE